LRIDLNADVGEAFGVYPGPGGAADHDAGLLRFVTSANVAAGFHAGDPSGIRETIRAAKKGGAAVGAHPGFPDLVGFGRRAMIVTPREAEDLVLYQIAAVAGIATAEGLRLQHVKPHGALFNLAVRDTELAGAIARATAAFDSSLILFGLPGSEILKAGRAAGLRVAAEAFADRAYAPDGSLISRALPGAVIHDPAVVVSRAVRMAMEKIVTAIDGSTVGFEVDTICVHSDTPGAEDLAARIRAGLEAAGVTVKAIGAL
jgi:5-oxoprolinase (ATP-hydrolysing) subunit A